MKLNRLQRYTAYCIMREEAENPTIVQTGGGLQPTNNNGLCFMITQVFDHWAYGKEIAVRLLPELVKYAPHIEPNVFWYDNWKQRIAALDKCIAETHPNK